MNFDEKQVEMAVLRQFDIDEKQPYQYESCFKQIEDVFISKNFDEDKIYRVWLGFVVQKDKAKFFVVTVDGHIEETDCETYESCLGCTDVLNFMHSDGCVYNVIYRSNGCRAIVPVWWLDVTKVMRFARLPLATPWAFEYRGDGEHKFFAWVFYPKNKAPRIFSIEDGEWHSEEEAFVKVPIKTGSCRIRTMELFCESGIIRRTMLQ